VTGERQTALVPALEALQRALEQLGAASMIVGGIAVIARGIPRLTVDVDALVWGHDLVLERLYSILEAHGIAPRHGEDEERAREQGVLLLEHLPTGTTMEILLAWLPFEKEAIDRASRVGFGGLEILAAQPEDLIVFKFVAWRNRDKDDIESLILLHSKKIDMGRIRGLVQELADALDEPQRLTEFEAIAERALGRGGSRR
jgi:predicted nucleotidyltransferase